MAAQGPSLGRRREVALGGDAILGVGELVGERRHELEDHVGAVGLDALLPVGVAARREVEERGAHAAEVARQVVDDDVLGRLGRALARRDLAVERARAALLERELRGAEEPVDPRIRHREPVAGEVAGLGDGHREERALAVVPGLDLGHDRDRDARRRIGGGDRDLRRARGQRRGEVDEQVDLELALVAGVDDPDEVDPGERGLLEQQGAARGDVGHTVTSRLRVRWVPRASTV